MDAPSTTAPSDTLRLLCKAAYIVLENGGETFRVEETVRRMAQGLGLEDVNVVAFATSIFVTDGKNTLLHRVSKRGTNLQRLTRANDVSRRVAEGKLTAAQAMDELTAIANDRGFSQPTLIAFSALTAGSFSLLFGGSIGTFLVGLLVGALVQIVHPLFSRLEMGVLAGNFCGGFISAFSANLFALFLPYGNINATIIGGIMPLLSGLLMTTAMRDTMHGDLLSGIARALDAVLLAAAVALGVFVGLKLFARMGGLL